MSDITDPVRVVRNDGSEEFRFKSENVDYNQSNGLVVDSVISALREIIGGKLVLESETYTVTGIIKDMEAHHYPNSGSYSDHDRGFETELRRAGKEWGFDTTDGFDLFFWGPRSGVRGVLTEVGITEDATATDMGAGSYEFEIEWTYLDAYVS